MTETVAKHRVGSKHFEIVVNLDEALKVKKNESDDLANTLVMNEIFYNSKSGEKASQSDLQEAFNTSDVLEVAKKIIQKGQIELPQEHRDEEREKKKKQVIEWFVRNALDAKTDRPFTPNVISAALDQTGVNIDNKPIEQQITKISEALKSILALKIETKKLIITIPAIHTGKAYGIIQEYKQKEEWLENGDLKATISIPTGLQSEFYDKLNAITHGAAITQEVKE